MLIDPPPIIAEAEQLIAERAKSRDAKRVNPADLQACEALEAIADEMTRLRAEIATLRNLFTNYLARN